MANTTYFGKYYPINNVIKFKITKDTSKLMSNIFKNIKKTKINQNYNKILRYKSKTVTPSCIHSMKNQQDTEQLYQSINEASFLNVHN